MRTEHVTRHTGFDNDSDIALKYTMYHSDLGKQKNGELQTCIELSESEKTGRRLTGLGPMDVDFHNEARILCHRFNK